MLALFLLELHTQRLLQRGAGSAQRGQVRPLDSRAGFTGVGGEEPGHIHRSCEWRSVEHRAPEILYEAFSKRCSGLAWRRTRGPEGGLARSEPEFFENGRSAGRTALDQKEIPVIRHQYQSITPEIFFYLFGFGHLLHLVSSSLDFNGAARRQLTEKRLVFVGSLELFGREKTAIG